MIVRYRSCIGFDRRFSPMSCQLRPSFASAPEPTHSYYPQDRCFRRDERLPFFATIRTESLRAKCRQRASTAPCNCVPTCQRRLDRLYYHYGPSRLLVVLCSTPISTQPCQIPSVASGQLNLKDQGM